MRKTVAIDHSPEGVFRYREGWAIVAVDVISTTTTAVTAVSLGRRCFPVATREESLTIKQNYPNAFIAGQPGSEILGGFDFPESPSLIASRSDIERPLILFSGDGTRLLHDARQNNVSYLACLRNFGATASYLQGRYHKIALIGAGTRGEFSEEDQLCCAWIAERLMDRGFDPLDKGTVKLVQHWHASSLSIIERTKSARSLLRTGQKSDLEFITSHINDVPMGFIQGYDEVFMVPVEVRGVRSSLNDIGTEELKKGRTDE